MREKKLADAYAVCTSRLHERGLKLHVETRATEVVHILDNLQKRYLTPTLAPFVNTFSPESCFWLYATDASGNPVAAGGTRFDDLGGTPVSDFWRHCATVHYGTPDEPCPIAVHQVVDRRLSGKLAYFGDLICDTKPGSLANLELFVNAGQMLTALKWDPDFTYAWVREHDVKRGAHIRYGFATRLANAQVWHDPQKPRSNHEQLCYSSRADLLLLAESITGDQSELS